MRIRTIKPEFFTHDRLFDAEHESGFPLRVAFAGLWCAADREGRFRWEPRRLGVSILPYDGIDFSRVLDALTTRGFVIKYLVGEAWFGFIPGFCRHQVINNRETPSEIPDISESVEVGDACPTRAPRVVYAWGTPVKRKGREGKGREGKVSGTRGLSGFEEFWEAYDKKKERPNAESAWMKIKAPIPPLNELLNAADAYVLSTPDKHYRKAPHRWLNQRCWEDEISSPVEVTPKSGGSLFDSPEYRPIYLPPNDPYFEVLLGDE